MRQCGVTGAVPSGSVGPKTATTGKPTAAATCIAPESLPRKRWHCERSAGSSAIAVLPVKLIGARFRSLTMASATCDSPGVPNMITSASVFCSSRLIALAKRSGGQHFAEPYDAPAPMARRTALGREPASNSFKEALLVAKMFNPTGPAQKFEIVEFFVYGNFAGLGNRDRFGEQQPAAVAGVTDALGNARAPGQPRGIESVLQ